MEEKRILIIEDDMHAAEVLEAYLKRECFAVAKVGDGVKGLEMVFSWQPDLVLLDVMLPGINGNEILARVRRKSDVPVIMVTAIGEIQDKISSFRHGVDDYIVKPYNPGEVVARVHAVLRRATALNIKSELIICGPVQLDEEAMLVHVCPAENIKIAVDLTPTEFLLLSVLMRAPKRAFSRQTLLNMCLPESDAFERVVDTHIYNLRKKLNSVGVDDVLLTVRAMGYRYWNK